MNPALPQPPFSDPEARLTALLLGELSPEETAAVYAELAAHPEQVQLLARLACTLPLVREAVRGSATGAAADKAPTRPDPDRLRLSPKRRAALLAAFKTVPPTEFAPSSRAARRSHTHWLALAAVLTVLLAVSGGMLLPALSKAKARGQFVAQKSAERLAERAQPPAEAVSTPLAPAAAEPASAVTWRASQTHRTLSPGGVEPTPAVESDAPLGTTRVHTPRPTPQLETATSTSPAPSVLAPPPPGAGEVLTRAPQLSQGDFRMMLRYGMIGGSVGGAGAGGQPPQPQPSANVTAEGTKLSVPALDTVPAPTLPQRAEQAQTQAAAAEWLGRLKEQTPDSLDRADRAGRAAVLAPPLDRSAAYGFAFPTPPAAAPATDYFSPRATQAIPLPETKQPVLGPEVQADQAPPTGRREEEPKGRALAAKPALLVHPPEVATAENPFSTFSLNVADVSFRLAAASLDAGQLPAPGGVRIEEFINAFDYHDPAPPPGAPLAFHWDRVRHPFAHNRELVRLSVQTAARGREPGRALNLVLVLDRSGSMERADRVATCRAMLRVLAAHLQPADRLSVITFARTARLFAESVPGNHAGPVLEAVAALTPEGGTHLEEALRLGYQVAARHFLPGGVNRVIMITDGAANLGEVLPESLTQLVEENRRRGVALDAFGVGWEDYNDELLEALTRHGDGRYGFFNSPEEAATGFAAPLAGALQVAAANVKVQIEFNPTRVTRWRQLGYARHQLTAEQFRDNTVDAAELGATETGTALYALEVQPAGQGPLGVFRVRYRDPATDRYHELAWTLAYLGPAPEIAAARPAMRLAVVAALFGEWLAQSPFAGDVTPERLLPLLADVPEVFAPDPRPSQLVVMLEQAQALAGH